MRILTPRGCAFDERHEVPNLDEKGFFCDLAALEVPILAHGEEQLVSVVHHLLDVH